MLCPIFNMAYIIGKSRLKPNVLVKNGPKLVNPTWDPTTYGPLLTTPCCPQFHSIEGYMHSWRFEKGCRP